MLSVISTIEKREDSESENFLKVYCMKDTVVSVYSPPLTEKTCFYIAVGYNYEANML